MLTIYHTDAQFVVNKDMVLKTNKGNYYLDEGQPLGLLKNDKGLLFIGEADGDQLELEEHTAGFTLLEACQPCDFEVALNEDGDPYIKEILIEQKVTLTEKVSKITLAENISSNTIKVTSIQ